MGNMLPFRLSFLEILLASALALLILPADWASPTLPWYSIKSAGAVVAGGAAIGGLKALWGIGETLVAIRRQLEETDRRQPACSQSHITP